MDIQKINFTSSASRSIDQLEDYANLKQHAYPDAVHLFYLCFKNSSGCFLNFLVSRGIDISFLKLEKCLEKFVKELGSNEKLSKNTKISKNLEKLIKTSYSLCKKYEHAYVGTEHIIYGFLENTDKFCDMLLSMDIDTEHLKLSVLAFLAGENPNIGFGDEGFAFDEDEEDEDEFTESNVSHLNKYCLLLNEHVKNPSFPIISGRDKEINLMQEVLCRKQKSNCILIGEAGTGKTTIVEGLTQLIESPNYDGPLLNKKVYSLDLGSLIAGTKYRGQFEARFSKLLSELKETPNSILFIDEIHTIIGAGGKEGSQDFANMIKPALARGEIKCIGATTSAEYKKHFEKDAALTRRFHPVYVEEPSIEDVASMVKGALPSYESHHNVKFSPSLASLSIKLCETYLPNQRFPDKVFDVIDQSSSKARIRNKKKSAKVLIDDVYSVIADKINVDVQTIKESNNKKFHTFESSLNDSIFGQKNNVSKIYDLLACAKAGLQNPDKPIASFFFVGPTSVGKTFTAKQIAKQFYGNEKSFLQLNMSEYQEQASISRLIGASAGYVGYEEGGILTEFVRKNPNSLILFDEAEKCNPNVLNLLLQILDEACLNDNLNRSIDFSRCIVVMTSNIGVAQADSPQLGFAPQQIDKEQSYKDSVKKSLPPELISRIDELIVFDSLDRESICKIFQSRLNEISKKTELNNIKLNFEISASDFIDFNMNDHARDIKKIVRQGIEIPLAKFLVQNSKLSEVSVKILDGKLNIC